MRAPAFDLVASHRIAIAGFVVAYASAEVLWLRVRRGHTHAWPELSANLFIYVVDTSIRLATWPARLGLFALVYAWSPLRLPTTALSAAVCYFGVDLSLYFYHRVLHETELGWALHSVHHTGRDFNLSLGVRINWLQRAIDDVVYLPLAVLGFEPLLVLAMVAFNRLSQYWVHTEMIGRLPLLDAVLNTPSNHRVHHEVAAGGVRFNYGSNFVIWDHCFGTYHRERDPIVFGTDAGNLGANPFVIQLAGLTDYVRRRFAR
jgi:sterol desaturase/sphingolipid hydroxylase (fatty acid hydroxylase superfamily)